MTLFDEIDANLRYSRKIYSQSLDLAKSQIKKNRDDEAMMTSRLCAMLLAAEYESRLHWLVNHPNSRLSDDERKEIRSNGGIANKWDLLLRIALARRYNLLQNTSHGPQDIHDVLTEVEKERYYRIRRTTRRHLRTLIDLRNSLAHGEWVSALNRKADGFNLDRSKGMNRISPFRVIVIANLLDHLWKLHFDALVTQVAYERDFSINYNGVINADRRLISGDESAWSAQIRNRYRDRTS